MSEAKQTPLLDLLRGIPADARMTYEHHPTHHQMIPVGRLAHEAAARIAGLEARLPSPDRVGTPRPRSLSGVDEVRKNIAAELRRQASQENCDGDPYDLMMEAADHIDYLHVKENVAMQAADGYINRLRDALRPFALICADDGDNYSSLPDNVIIRTEVTAGEIREAREALGTWLHGNIEKERTNDANP